MKKKITIFLALILVLATTAFPTFAGVDGASIVTAPYTTTAPEIDGKLDDIWKTAAKIVPEYHSFADPQTSATVYVLCDEKFIYVFADVLDSVPDSTGEKTYQKDSVNLVIDYNYNRDPSFQYGDADPVISMNFSSINTGGGDYIWKAIQNDKGYTFEGKLPILTKYVAGGKIGFEVIINDAQNGDRVDMLMWDENGGDSWAFTNVLGTLIYGEKPAEPAPAPVEEAAAEPEANPETTDVSIIALSLSAIISGAGMFFSKRNRK
jgi:hypothetical protein